MNIVSTKEISDIRYLLGSSVTAPNMYRQIRATFPDSNVYMIFAEPIVLEDGRKIAWSSSYPGGAVCYSRLSDEDKSEAQDILSRDMNALVNAVKKFNDNSIVEFMNNCMEIPTLDDVYLVGAGPDRHAVITEWGFVPDTPGAEKGLLIKFLNIRKIPMKFNVVYNDDLTPAPFEDVLFEVDGKPMSAKSDAEGVITLEKIKENAFVKAWDAQDNEKKTLQTYNCYPDGKYTIKVIPKGDMKVQVVDQDGNIQSNVTFLFTYNEQTIQAVSNADGLITIERLKNGTKVEAFQNGETGTRENLNTFIFDRKTPLYKIVLPVIKVAEPTPPPPPPPPQTHNMRFKVVDEKNNIVKSAEITVKYNGKTETLWTDAEGYAELKDVPLGTVVEAKAKK